MPLSKLRTTAEAAVRLNYTPRYVAKLAAAGKLQPLRKLPGRTGDYLFAEDELARYEASRPGRDAAAHAAEAAA